MKIEKNQVVSFHYTLKDKVGRFIDGTKGKEPLSYIQGIGALIIGLESQLEGRKKGNKFKVMIPPEQGYGIRDQALIYVVKKSDFQGTEEMKLGMQVKIDTDNEGMAIATIIEIDGDKITLDLNHPLVDIALYFDIEVIDVRRATENEINTGHIDDLNETNGSIIN